MAESKETVFFISSTFKGLPMLRSVKEQGCHVLLLTEENLKDEPWPLDVIDEIFYTPDLARYRDVIHTVAYLNRGRKIDRFIPLDEFEVELVAMIREHLRVPGTRVSQVHHFRDKLAMRQITNESGIRVPDFIGIKNYDDLRDYMASVEPPWVLKPRSEASAMGIRKIHDSEQLWRVLDELGDNQTYYLLEKFLPGDVYHVDSIVVDGKVAFVSPQKYGAPPMSIYQGGGVFSSRTLKPRGKEATVLRTLNKQVIAALGMEYGVTHMEFIRAHADDEFYFLEVAARVGGAFLSDLIEYGTGVNLWTEWGRLEVAQLRGEKYTLPPTNQRAAALILTLAKQKHPDLSAYDVPEIVWRADKVYHAGLILVSDDYDRIEQLMADYLSRFAQDFTAVADPLGPQRTGRET